MISRHFARRLAAGFTVHVVFGIAAAAAQPQVLVRSPALPDTRWHTVGLAAQPLPVASSAHAVTVRDRAFGSRAVEVEVAGAGSAFAGGTEWTGRFVVKALDAAGNPYDNPEVGVIGAPIAITRVVGDDTIYDDVRFRIANFSATPVRVAVWAEMRRPINTRVSWLRFLTGTALYHNGAFHSSLTAIGSALQAPTGRVASWEYDVWPTSPPTYGKVDPVAGTRTTSIGLLSRRDAAIDIGWAQVLEQDYPFYPPHAAPLPTAQDGYNLVQAASGKCAYVASPGVGAAVTLGPCGTDPRSVFYPTSTSPSQRFFVNGASGLCLDLPGHAPVHGAGTVTSDCEAHDAQRWGTLRSGFPAFQFTVVNLDSGYCLDTENAALAVDTPIVQGTCIGSSTQLWQIMPAR